MAIWHGMPWDDSNLEKDLNGMYFSTQRMLHCIKLTEYKHVWYHLRVPFNETSNGDIYFKENIEMKKLAYLYWY